MYFINKYCNYNFAQIYLIYMLNKSGKIIFQRLIFLN